MADPSPGEGDRNPFEGIPFFADLARMLQAQGPVNWDAARQTAASLTGGATEPNPDPVERMRLEELARVADLRVTDATGLATSTTGELLTVLPVTRAEWARRTLDAYRPLLERLASALTAALGDVDDETGEGAGDPTGQLLGGLLTMIGPVMLGVQAGAMVGHQATRSLGQYDLPLPRPRSDELLVVPANLESFGTEWSLPADDLRLWVCLSEMTTHAVLGVPHVRNRLQGLVLDYVGAFRAEPDALEERLGGLDLSDPSALPEALGDPASLLGAISSAEQRALQPPLEALVAVLVGYVDHVLDRVAQGLLSSPGMLSEALRRRRVEASSADRYVEALLGLRLDAATYERGSAFVGGVVERGGEAALSRLWTSARELPTPPEVDAPGLWLARIDLDD